MAVNAVIFFVCEAVLLLWGTAYMKKLNYHGILYVTIEHSPVKV